MSPTLRTLQCVVCGADSALTHRTKCPSCGGILNACYDGSPEEWHSTFDAAVRDATPGMWRWRGTLPVPSRTKPVHLGEGDTPLITTDQPEAWGAVPGLHFKCETANPTGSFKDRPASVALSMARAWGVPGVVTASSGNAGASVAAYAARAGLPAVVLVPDDLPAGKASQIALYGPTLIAVRGHFSRAYDLALHWAERSGWYDVTSTLLSAFPTEGNKTVAYELWRQAPRVPDWILVPVSSGPLLVGIAKGFAELRYAGLIDREPRLVAVQAAGCAPIAAAYDAGHDEVRAWGDPETVASGIRDPLQGYADDGSRTLQIARQTGGLVLAVDDDAILDAAGAIARYEGVAAEPTGAVAVAGARRMIADGRIAPEDEVVCLVTGHGLKDPVAYVGRNAEPIPIDPDPAALTAALASLGLEH